MTATPLFVGTVPDNPTREATVNFTDGSLTASRGLIAAIFKDATFVSSCAAVEIERTRKQYTRTEYIGATPRVVQQSSWTQTKYPSQTKSVAKGGEAIQVKVNGEYWTARLSGTHQAFMEFLCDGPDSPTRPISLRSERGTSYGPIAPTTTTGD